MDKMSNVNLIKEVECSVAIQKKIPIRIISLNSIVDCLLLQPIAEFLKANPHIKLELVTGKEQGPIYPGEIHIRSAIIQQKDIIKTELMNHKMTFVVSKEYLDLHGTPSNLDLLNRYDFLAYNPLNTFLEGHIWIDSDGSISEPVFLSNSYAAILGMCSKGLGIAVLPDYSIKGYSLVEVLKDIDLEPTSIYLAYLNGGENYPAVKETSEFLMKLLKKN